jgi:hypothetical protein
VVGSLVEQQAGGGGNVGDYLTHLTNLYSTILVKCVEPSNVGTCFGCGLDCDESMSRLARTR